MSKKLGKGLGALLGDSYQQQSEEDKKSIHEAILYLPIDDVTPNPHQPRTFFDQEKLLELSQSLLSVGMIEPIVVSKKQEEEHYTIIAGERRFRAALLAGFKKVPCLINNRLEGSLMEAMLVENIQREDLSPTEEALCFQKILESKHMTHEDLGVVVGKTRSYVTNHLRLLELPAEIQEDINAKLISMGHAKVLVGLSEAEQKQLVSRIKNEHLSVRSIEELAREQKNKFTPSNSSKKNALLNAPFKESLYSEVEEALRGFFQTKVSVSSQKGDKGVVSIDYYGKEGLEKILEKLGLSL